MTQPRQLRHVLVGVDERELSRHAIEAGLWFESTLGAELELVHAITVESYVSTLDWHALHERLVAAARERCTGRFERDFPEHAAKLTEALRLVDGPPGKALLHRAEESSADLIVLGSHTKHGIFDFGGTARAVLHKSPCPVMMQPYAVEKLQRILVPIDMSESNRHVLEWARAIAMRTGAKVRILHWFVPPYFAYEPLHGDLAPVYTVDALRKAEEEEFGRFASTLDWSGVDVEEHFGEGEPLQSVLAEQRHGDLVVMGTHGRSSWTRAVIGSVAYGVLKAARTPVLAVPFDASLETVKAPVAEATASS